MDRSAFLKCRFLSVDPAVSLSLSLFPLVRVTTMWSPLFIPDTSRRLLVHLLSAMSRRMYAFASPFNSFVIHRLRAPPFLLRHRITLAFLFHSLLPHRFTPRRFRARALSRRGSLCAFFSTPRFNVFWRVYLSVAPRAYLSSRMRRLPGTPFVLFSSFFRESEANVFRCTAFAATHFPAVVYTCKTAPLNYARNYARPDRVSALKMHTMHTR